MSWIFVLAALASIAGSQGLGRRPLLPGGAKILTEEEIKKDEALPTVLLSIADHYNKMSNSLFAYRITETKQVKRRVVAGLEYEIIMQLAPTECKKNADKYTKEDPKNCKLSVENGRPHTCTFTAWYRPWLILGAPQRVKVDMKSCQ